MAPKRKTPRIVAGPPGPPAPKAWGKGRSEVSEALEGLDVNKSLVMVGSSPLERARARSAVAYLQKKLGRRYATRTRGENQFVIWRTA